MQKLLLLLPLLTTLPGALAEAQRPVLVGDTVRVALADGGPPLRGIITSSQVDRITLRIGPGDDREIFTSVIQTMNRLDGRKRATARGAQVGLLAGILAGVGLSAIDALSNGAAEFREGQIPARLLIGGLGGTLVGLTAGVGFETNRWVAAEAPATDRMPSFARGRVTPWVGKGVEARMLVGVRLRR